MILYDVCEKNINKNIKLDFILLDVRYIKKKNAILINGGTDMLRSNICIYDSNFNRVQIIQKVHLYILINFFYEKEDLLMSYSQDGNVNIYSFIENI